MASRTTAMARRIARCTSTHSRTGGGGATPPPRLPGIRMCRGLAPLTVGTLVALAAFAGATAAAPDVGATLRVCGARDCATLKTTVARLRIVIDGHGSSPLPPPAGAFYVLKLSVEGAPRVQKGWYVPSSRTTRWLIPAPSKWTKLRRRGAAFMQQHLPPGPPHLAPRPVRVVVANRPVLLKTPYAHVLDRFPEAPGPPPNARWITVRVTWPVGTPWRFEHTNVFVLPSRRILARPGGWFFIPAAFARVIARDAHP